jgi:LysR family carnitine catabolism transcriptional activator
MDERRLRIFLAIVEEGGVTRAAERLELSQPSVSQALRALEEECGTELFHRLGRGLRLTAIGEALVGPARHAMRSLSEVRIVIREASGLAVGRLDIGALSTLAAEPLAALIGQFRHRYKGISVHILNSEGMAELVKLVQDAECELGIAHLPLTSPGLLAHHLGRQDLHVVLPPSTQIEDAPLPIARLAEFPLIVAPPLTSTRLLLEAALSEAGYAPRVAVETAAREAPVRRCFRPESPPQPVDAARSCVNRILRSAVRSASFTARVTCLRPQGHSCSLCASSRPEPVAASLISDRRRFLHALPWTTEAPDFTGPSDVPVSRPAKRCSAVSCRILACRSAPNTLLGTTRSGASKSQCG